MLADIGAVTAALGEIDVDEATIRSIVAILEENVSDLEGGAPGTLPASSLGGSDSGAWLAHQTALAHGKVVKAMQEMVAGLKGYQANIHRFHQDISFADDDSSSRAALTTGKVHGVTPTVLDSAGCANAPDVHTNPSCSIPTGSTGGDS